jgi:hypothetical protein
MKSQLILIVASVAALSACNRGATNNSTAAAPSTGGTVNTAAPAAPAPTAGPVDPQLTSQLSMAAQAMSTQLPMTQQTPNGPVTFTAMEARGNELVTTMSLPMDLDQASFGTQFGQALPAQACSNPQMAALVGRGAKITYVVEDSGGEEFTASVSSC